MGMYSTAANVMQWTIRKIHSDESFVTVCLILQQLGVCKERERDYAPSTLWIG